MSLTDFCKRNNFLNYLITCLITILCLSACGLSGDRGGTNGRTASNGGGSGGSDGSGNDLGNDDFNIKEIIGIRVERLNGEVDKVSPSQISIVSLSEAFQEIGSGSTPNYRVEDRLMGGYEIQFESLYTERINQVVKVTFNSRSTPKEILYAPLYTVDSETESITVNAKSHYLLKKLFDSVPNSTKLAELLPCSSSITNCLNQSQAKSNMLEQISIAVEEYNVSIPTTVNINQAIALLDQRLDLKEHIESAVNEITRIQSPFAKGTKRSQIPVSAVVATPLTYHSVYFGLSLSDMTPADSNRSIKISSLSSKITPDEEGNNTYPYLFHTISLLDLRRDVLSSQIPFERTNLQISQNNNFTLIDNEDTNGFNSLNLTDSFLSTQGFLLNERVIDQTIPGLSGSIGWEFEPLFSRSYHTNEYEPPSDGTIDESPDYGNAPTWLTSSNFSKAASYSLTDSGVRGEQLEDMNIFSWEVHGLEIDRNENFSTSTLNGKEYGAISYSLKLNDEDNSNVIQLLAETAKWNISGGTIYMTQPSSHYQTLSLSRNQNNSTLGVRTENNLLDSPRAISALATVDSNGTNQQGLISFGGQGTGQPQGHSTSNGSYLALAFNTKQNNSLDRGQGIILASEIVSFNYLFSGEIYQLQGNSMEITTEKNSIHQLNDSSLSIESLTNSSTNDCQANISVKRTSVAHTVGTQDNTLSSPSESAQSTATSQRCTVDGSELYIEFSNIFNEPLILRGFISQKNDALSNKPGNLINLIWQQNNQLGLVFANKEQDLSATFN